MPWNYNHLTRDMRHGINDNNFIYMYFVSIIIINIKEDISRSFLELRLPGFEISGIGIGIEISGIGIGIGFETYCE